MAIKLPGTIEKQRQGYQAVVTVPPSLRAIVGKTKLKKGLGTRDRHVAEMRAWAAIQGLHKVLEAARRASPQTDAMAAEAMEWRGYLQEAQQRPSGMVVRYEMDERGRPIEITEAEEQADIIADRIASRAEQIEQMEGPERAQSFADLAFGRVTPLSHHLETWLGQPGPHGRQRHERTKAEYRGIVGALGEWLASQGMSPGLEHITRRVAGQYVTALHDRGLSGARIRDLASALSGYWKWMEARGILADGANPWSRQAPAKPREVVAGGEEEERPFTAEEVRKLLDNAPDAALGDLMRVAALTGMRVEEICQLTAGQCQGDTFNVRGTKTAAAVRRVPIHPDLAPIVSRRIEGKSAASWLFHEFGEPNRYGKRSVNATARFHRFRVEQGVDDKAPGQRRSRVNFHSWRRWFITEALRAKQPERVVKQVVGHKLPKADVTLGVYFGGDLDAALRECVEAVRLPAETSGAP